jgi:hypothetical protein
VKAQTQAPEVNAGSANLLAIAFLASALKKNEQGVSSANNSAVGSQRAQPQGLKDQGAGAKG